MALSDLPAPIAAFLQATAARDSQALLAAFAAEAVLTDEGKTLRGKAIAEWNQRLYLGANVRVHPIRRVDQGGQTALTVIVDGDYASIGVTEPFQLDWFFTVTGDKIASLRVVQPTAPDVPAAVLTYIGATNSFDLDRAMAAFADGAIANDQHREYDGLPAIREWLGREIIGDRVTMFVTGARRRNGRVIVTADIDGDYDKTGLPDPLTLTFYFTVAGDRIDQLIILHNKAGAAAA